MCGVAVHARRHGGCRDQPAPPLAEQHFSHAAVACCAADDCGGSVEAALRRRGPDHYAVLPLPPLALDCADVLLAASVLHIRGDDNLSATQPIPLHDSASCDTPPLAYLAWNGEIYDQDIDICNRCDTLMLADLLKTLLLRFPNCPNDFAAALVKLLYGLDAEFSLVLVHVGFQRIYYGRDYFGRRSLLRDSSVDGEFTLSSTFLTSAMAHEVPATGIHSYDLVRFSDASLVAPWPSMPLISVQQTHVLDTFYQLLSESVRRRCASNRAEIAVMFSGGLDCTVLAALVNMHFPSALPIELINVAFGDDPASCPDRINALNSFNELKRVAPKRDWRLRLVDVSKSQVDAHRIHLVNLISPANTVMDISLALPFYYAAANSQSRILLSGLGADELLGGYKRHRTVFDRGGTEALRQELDADLARLSTRNLGRDDRVVADCGKEVRYPFLELGLVSFISSLEPHQRCDLRLPSGQGDKLLLRTLARDCRVGLHQVAGFEKRAAQFGSRSAKLQMPGTKGTDRLG